LTGLPNRAFFRQHLGHELQQAVHRSDRLALLCLDLDNFKSVNDTLGHPAGDELLKIVADRLRSVAGEGQVARLGADEFAIIIPHASGDVAVLARTLIARISEPCSLGDGKPVTVTASVGIAFAPSDASDGDTLLKNADLALNRAKAEGRATFRFFEAEMNARAQARHQIEMDLRGAIAAGQLELHYQPLVALETDRIGSFEALLRWNHPVRGRISPLEFVPIAEETGLIVPIGNWVIQEACREALHWPDHVRVAVNVSSIQFREPGLETVVLQALAASGLTPERLEIEITESIFLESSETILSILHKLRAIGVRIALDDFGTGYSSLGYLQSFPFDKIKIDRSFTEQILVRPDSAAIVAAVSALARALGMESTAEGVETEDQLEQLRRDGCTSVQGFLLSAPVGARQARAFFDTEQELQRGAA
jgi:diguanylate cyclase (GGDEF)-like protein